jgi:hypothetical protein
VSLGMRQGLLPGGRHGPSSGGAHPHSLSLPAAPDGPPPVVTPAAAGG